MDFYHFGTQYDIDKGSRDADDKYDENQEVLWYNIVQDVVVNNHKKHNQADGHRDFCGLSHYIKVVESLVAF